MKFKILFEENLKDWININNSLYLNAKFIINNYKYNEFVLEDLYTALNEINKDDYFQPSKSKVENAGILQFRADWGTLIYKSGGGSMSDNLFTSQLNLFTTNKDGFEVKKIFIRGISSNNIEDVYIHNVDIDKIEKIINKFSPKNMKWEVFWNKIFSYIKAGETAIRKKNFVDVDSYLKFFNIENQKDFTTGFKKYKNELIKKLKDYKKYNKKNVIFIELIDRIIKMIMR